MVLSIPSSSHSYCLFRILKGISCAANRPYVVSTIFVSYLELLAVQPNYLVFIHFTWLCVMRILAVLPISCAFLLRLVIK